MSKIRPRSALQSRGTYLARTPNSSSNTNDVNGASAVMQTSSSSNSRRVLRPHSAILRSKQEAPNALQSTRGGGGVGQLSSPHQYTTSSNSTDPLTSTAVPMMRTTAPSFTAAPSRPLPAGVFMPPCVSSAVSAREAAAMERRKRHATARLKMAESDAIHLLAEIFELCEELQMGNRYIMELQNVLATPQRDGAAADRLNNAYQSGGVDLELLTEIRQDLSNHKQVTLHVLECIEARERVMRTFNDFIRHFTAPSFSSRKVPSERDEVNAFKRQALSAAAEVEAESIVASIALCSAKVSSAISEWKASAAVLDAWIEPPSSFIGGGGGRAASWEGQLPRTLSALSESTQQTSNSIGLPPPVERRFLYRDSDYLKKMHNEKERIRRLQEVWRLPSVHHQQKKKQERQEEEEKRAADSLASSVNSATRLDQIRSQMEEDASVQIQRVFRGHRKRLEYHYFTIRTDAAQTIQRWYRAFLLERLESVVRGRNIAATRIQSLWRGVAAREAFQYHKRADKAARKVQRRWRTYAAHLYWSQALAERLTRLAAVRRIARWLWSLKFKVKLEQHRAASRAAVVVQRWFRSIHGAKMWESNVDAQLRGHFNTICAKEAPLDQPSCDISTLHTSAIAITSTGEAVAEAANDSHQHQHRNEAIVANTTLPIGVRNADNSHEGGASPLKGAKREKEKDQRAANSVLLATAQAVEEEEGRGRRDDATEARDTVDLQPPAPEAKVEGDTTTTTDIRQHAAIKAEGEEETPDVEMRQPSSTSELAVLPPFPSHPRRIMAVLRPSSASLHRDVLPIPVDRMDGRGGGAVSKRHGNTFWCGDSEAARLLQAAGRAYRGRVACMLALTEKRHAAILEKEAALRTSAAIITQSFARCALAVRLVATRRARDHRYACVLQGWWRRWRRREPSVVNRRHREYLLESHDAHREDDLMKALSSFTPDALRYRKQQAEKISGWFKRQYDRRRRNAEAQRTIRRAWYFYKSQRQYFLRRRERKLAALEEETRQEALALKRENMRKMDAGLVILYYYLKYRVRSLIGRIDAICADIRQRPDRDENARTLQRFWKAAVARIQALKLRRIRASITERSLQEERLLMGAIKIQSLYRLVLAKKRVAEKKRRIAADREYAASLIQRNVRMMLAKIRADELRLGRLSMYKEYRLLMLKSQNMQWHKK